MISYIKNVRRGTEYPWNSLLLIWPIEYLPETRVSGIFEAEIYREIPKKIPYTKITFWIDLLPETYFLIYLNDQKNLNGSEWQKMYPC